MRTNKIKKYVSRKLGKYLTKHTGRYQHFAVQDTTTLQKILVPGDVLLVEGDLRISTAIKYFTQSTWSHSAFYAGSLLSDMNQNDNIASIDQRKDNSQPVLIEADLENGVIAVPLAKYKNYNLRICRPANISPEDARAVCKYMIDSLGMSYDLKNITDLARYMLPALPIPIIGRSRMQVMGSGDPTRAVCSSLIAQAFQSVAYPILPQLVESGNSDCEEAFCYNEILHIRHHSLFTPRDFDLSPYFSIVKPEFELGFDYKKINWQKQSNEFNRTGRITVDVRS